MTPNQYRKTINLEIFTNYWLSCVIIDCFRICVGIFLLRQTYRGRFLYFIDMNIFRKKRNCLFYDQNLPQKH